MELTKSYQESTATIAVSGRLDALTSAELETELTQTLAEDNTTVVLDCASLEYISSAGLRVLMSAHKACLAGGKNFEVVDVCPDVSEVLAMTGFDAILNLRSSS